MTVLRFLRERIRFVIFYAAVVGFAVLLAVVDRANRMLPSNAGYLLVVLLVLALLYLSIEYSIQRSHHARLARVARGGGRGWTGNLPSPVTAVELSYQDMLRQLDHETIEEIERAQLRSREDLDFITTWVHEIKTPIAAAHLLIENHEATPLAETLDSLREELDRIEDYVNRALFYSRTNDFSRDYLVSECSLERVVRDCVKRHARAFIRKGISVVLVDLDYEVVTDRKWLGFVLDQVVANSLKYTPSGGKVKISATRGVEETVLSVADNGVGIRPEDLERVFERGFTGQRGREELRATGMGLYLAQRVARKLGHYLEVLSDYGQGTTMTIHFPKYPDDQAGFGDPPHPATR